MFSSYIITEVQNDLQNLVPIKDQSCDFITPDGVCRTLQGTELQGQASAPLDIQRIEAVLHNFLLPRVTFDKTESFTASFASKFQI